MNNEIMNKLKYSHMKGTKNTKKICDYLINLLNMNQKPEFSTIQVLATLSGVSTASVNRFVYASGWPTFKHFIHDFHDHFNAQATGDDLRNEIGTRKKDFNWCREGLDHKKIKFICSKKSRYLGKLISERFIAEGWNSTTFEGTYSDVAEYASKLNNEDYVVLVTISGGSLIVSKTIEEISKNRLMGNPMPNILVVSSAQWLDVFSKYSFIKYIHIDNDMDLESNWGYNESLIKIADFFLSNLKCK